MGKRRRNAEDEDARKKAKLDEDLVVEPGRTWTSGPLTDLEPDMEPRHVAGEELCKSDHVLSIKMLLRFCHLGHFESILETNGVDIDHLLRMKVTDFPEFLTCRSRKKLTKAVRSVVTCVEPEKEESSIFLIRLPTYDRLYCEVEKYMCETIRKHKNNTGGIFDQYLIEKIECLYNPEIWGRYVYQRAIVAKENGGQPNERMLYHGSPYVDDLITVGFDERHTTLNGMFGAGIYHADISSKGNLYSYGNGGGTGCTQHHNKSCYSCSRRLLLCRVSLGCACVYTKKNKRAHPPEKHNSVIGLPSGVPSSVGLAFPEYIVYRGEQTHPQFVITYKLVKPES